MGPRTGRLHSAYCRNTSRNKGWLRICFRCHLGVRDGFCSRAWCIWVGGGGGPGQVMRGPQEGALRLQGEGFPGCRAGSASHCASRGSLTCAGWQSPAGAGATHKSAQCRKTRRIQHRCRLQGAAGREPQLGRVPGRVALSAAAAALSARTSVMFPATSTPRSDGSPVPSGEPRVLANRRLHAHAPGALSTIVHSTHSAGAVQGRASPPRTHWNDGSDARSLGSAMVIDLKRADF